MKRRLDHALEELGTDGSAEAILALLAQYPMTETQPCLRPGCPNLCIWQATGGRPKLYCSANCRRRALHERDALERTLVQMTANRPHLDSARRRQVLETRIANVRWQLARYPSGH